MAALLRSRLSAAAVRSFSTTRAAAAVNVGDIAPDFTLHGAGFKTKSLSEAKGKKAVLAFFPAAFSGSPNSGCELQLCSLKPVSEAGVVVYGISGDLPFTQGAWEQKLGLSYPCLFDKDLKVSEQYVGTLDLGAFLDSKGVTKNFGSYKTSPRAVVIVDENGQVIYKWVGQDEKGNAHPGIAVPVAEIKAALKLK